MLIRLACAIKEKKIQAALDRQLSEQDVQVKFFEPRNTSWQDLVRSCADVIVVSKSVIPEPIEASVAILNRLPEKPVTVILHDRESSQEHANLLALGADMVLYSGISPNSMTEAITSTLDSRRQFYGADRYDQRGRFQPRLNDFVSNSRHMQMFYEELRHVVTSDASILLLGETGVGKEHLSKAIHAESHRSAGPFIAINMAAIPEALMESELFGHEQGAFTGAIRSRRGAFELAHGGTLFLDEIGDMPLTMQSKLLRVLQDFEFTPVGGEKPVWVDARVIAATNRDLDKEIQKGNFRPDLYYRLSVITLTLPPLRYRKEDIPFLANHFLNIYREKIGREIDQFTKEAMDALCSYAWPGNIRELMNVIERAVLLCTTGVVSTEFLPHNVQMTRTGMPILPDFKSMIQHDWHEKPLAQVRQEVLDHVEKAYLEIVLEKTRGRVGLAAKTAGIHPRSLYTRMKKLGLDKARFKKKQ